MKNNSLKSMWNESFSFFSKGELSKIVLTTLNNVQRSYLLTGRYAWFFGILSIFFFLIPRPSTLMEMLFSLVHIPTQLTLYINPAMFIFTISIFLQHYTRAAAVSKRRKDAIYFSTVNWPITICCMIQALSFTALSGSLFLTLPALLIFLFSLILGTFFIYDLSRNVKTTLESIIKGTQLTIYFFPFILISVPLLSIALMLTTTIGIYAVLSPFAFMNIISLKQLLSVQALNKILLLELIYLITPFLISLAAILHTKVKFSHFSLFYNDEQL